MRQHPLVALMKERGWDLEAVVKQLARRGRKTSEAYVRHIIAYRKRPSFDFARDLAAVFGGEISAEKLLLVGPIPGSAAA
jgi:hypothetical protein